MENSNPSVIKTNHENWKKAQTTEEDIWVSLSRRNGYLKLGYKFFRALKHPKLFWQYIMFRDFYCGDDWNYWWMAAFEYYKVLPKELGRSLEVGSGPYSNTRLISKIVKIKEIYCVDPLMDTYLKMHFSWVAENARRGRIKTLTGKGEQIDFPNEHFDLVICNNVLDHVEDAEACFKEIIRVLKPGGYFVFGQDLTDEHDLENPAWRHDHVHPIKLHHTYIDSILLPAFEPKLYKILSRQQGRHPNQNYGNYVFIGRKK